MNNIVIVGRLTRDPETNTTNGGKTVAKMSVAVDKQFKRDGDSADFFSVEVWGQSAEYVQNYGSKGRMVSVSGRMESRQYEAKEGGKRTVWDIKAERVSFIGGVRDDGQRQATATVADDFDPFADQ